MTVERGGSEILFVDANIPMYVAGKEHPLREPCRQAMALISKESVNAVTSAEVHQEILHRYFSLGRPEQARAVSKTLQTIIPTTLPVTLPDIVRARELSIAYPNAAARDLIHVAVMLNHGMTHILSVDRHFDEIAEVVRVSPESMAPELAQPGQEPAAPGEVNPE